MPQTGIELFGTSTNRIERGIVPLLLYSVQLLYNFILIDKLKFLSNL